MAGFAGNRLARAGERVGSASSRHHYNAALLEIVDSPPHPAARAVLATLLAMFAALLAWAAFGRLDIIAVAEGRLIPASRLKIVQPAEAGVVKEILVAEGDRVRSGQVLVRMDPAFNAADRQALNADYRARRLALRRIDAQITEHPFDSRLDDPPELFARIAAEHAAEVHAHRGALAQERAALERARHDLAAAREVRAKLQQVLPHYAEQEQAYDKLARDGFMGRLMVTEKSRERIEKEQDLRAQDALIRAAEARIAESEQRLRQIDAEYRRRLQAERVATAIQVDKLEQEIAKQERRGELLELTAPQDAIVKELATHTAGTVVAPGTVLLTLVPENDALRAEIWVENDDIGFVHPGQPVRLKMAAYPFQKYGMLDGRVAQIGADATEPRPGAERGGAGAYRALVDIPAPHLEIGGARLALSPGMAVAAEIRLGERTVLEYLLSPISRAFHEAGRER